MHKLHFCCIYNPTLCTLIRLRHRHSPDADAAVNQMVRLLLREGANCDAVDQLGRTPLHWAACLGHSDVIHDLVQCGANVNAADTQVDHCWLRYCG